MTFKFNGLQLGKTVPATLIIFKQIISETDFIYLGIIGNQFSLDAARIAEKSLDEVFKRYNLYLEKNQIKLFEVTQRLDNSLENLEIYNAYYEAEHILFIK